MENAGVVEKPRSSRANRAGGFYTGRLCGRKRTGASNSRGIIYRGNNRKGDTIQAIRIWLCLVHGCVGAGVGVVRVQALPRGWDDDGGDGRVLWWVLRRPTTAATAVASPWLRGQDDSRRGPESVTFLGDDSTVRGSPRVLGVALVS